MDEQPGNVSLIESIKEVFLESVEPITKSELKALNDFPVQFVDKVSTEDGWTTQLHIWAEQGVDELINLDPIYFITKDSDGDTILSSIIKGALGLYTDMVDYPLLDDILSKDFNYEIFEGDQLVIKNALDELNSDSENSLDIIVDFAWSQGEYEDTEEDPKLQEMLKEFVVKYKENQEYIKDMTEEINEDLEDEDTEEESTDDSDNDSDS